MNRKIFGILFLAVMSASCSPQTFNLGIELRSPSKSGMSLANKNISVIYMDDGKMADSLFLSSISDGFAQTLEKDYFGGDEAIGIYRVDKDADVDYMSKDNMARLLVETGSDVTFLFDLVSMGETAFSAAEPVATSSAPDSSYFMEASTPFAIKLYAYDAMNPQDTVQVFNGSSTAKSPVYTSGDESNDMLVAKAMSSMDEQGYSVGRQSAGIFLSTWTNSNFTMYYYEDSDWYQASQAAYDYKWTAAMDKWISLLDTKDLRKRSCLEYNLAVVNYILGQKSLASQWLDRSDTDYRLPESSNLRQKINRL